MPTDERHYPLIEFLQKHVNDRAMLASLRRGLGQTPGAAPEMFPYVTPFVHKQYQEPNYYLVASLFGLHPQSANVGNMGNHLRRYANEVGDDAATQRRFVQLLRMRRESLDTPLRQHISLLKAKEIPINWNQLLYDLEKWGNASRFVQRNWAATFWRTTA